MSRQASELTLAMRELFSDTSGSITFTQAIPLLREMGHTELVNGKPEMSDHLVRFNQAARELEESDGKEPTKSKIRIKARLSRIDIQNIDDELEVRGRYEAQENGFNVNKSIWKKAQTEGSRKPVATNGKAAAQREATSPVRTAASPAPPKHRRSAGKITPDTPRRPKHRAVVQFGNLQKLLTQVTQQGGVEGIEKKLGKTERESTRLQATFNKEVATRDKEVAKLQAALDKAVAIRDKEVARLQAAHDKDTARLDAEVENLESLRNEFSEAKSAFDKAAA